ncbi:vesicular glutamate transporter 3-like isoform X2 [Sitodiplosis mosellana]|uniref:vesicular glutamate transporter 3-like isoform X2 n=1 Tax=Sitodiplosis mosellana TaxID=263140 RepID=UPI0024443130|nr:vesicular glutamate transporter 3-like isoform X2 [Sitodiplosis mosellana]
MDDQRKDSPPLRNIVRYVRPDFCGFSARYTVAFMAMLGFVISFGMKCNLSAAKSERVRMYNATSGHIWKEEISTKFPI